MIKIMYGVKDLEVDILEANLDFVRYSVNNTPVCQYDQHSRARIGAEFYHYQPSIDPEYVVYTAVHNKMKEDPAFEDKVIKALSKLEKSRDAYYFEDNLTLMSRNCCYEVKQTWKSLQGQMSRRLKFCEEEFIVGLHWLLRDKLIEKGFGLAEVFKPFCDILKKCDYSSADYLSNMFGCLFAGCGRWPDETDFATFNQSCTDRKELEKQLGINIPISFHEENLLNIEKV